MSYEVHSRPVKRGNATQRYPWNQLDSIGDCFLVPKEKIERKPLSNAAISAGKIRGKQFRVTDETENWLVQYVGPREAK